MLLNPITTGTVRRSCLGQVYSHVNYHRLDKRTCLLLDFGDLVHFKATKRGLAFFQSDTNSKSASMFYTEAISDPNANAMEEPIWARCS